MPVSAEIQLVNSLKINDIKTCPVYTTLLHQIIDCVDNIGGFVSE